MLTLLGVHLLVALLLPLLAGRYRRAAWLLAVLVPLAAVVWAALWSGRVLDGHVPQETLSWASVLQLELVLRLDSLSLLMVFVISGVGALVLLYGSGYFADGGREAGLLVGFAGAMFGLVTADHLIALYIFWELTSVISFLLIAGRGQGVANRKAAEQALLTTAGGGLAMLFGFILLGREAGTYRISQIVADPPAASGALAVAVVLVLCGAFAKSAQAPLSAWLPAAMVAPTPISAYLHAAAMVKAGVYLVARLTPALVDVQPWQPAVLAIGLLTMVLGAWRAMRQTDLKLLLAYGTVSELGMLTALLGAGGQTAMLAGEEMLLAHACFKSALFLTVGVLERSTGTRELHRLSGVGRSMPVVCGAAVLSVASMAGLPPLVGYLGKEAAYEAMWHADFAGRWWAVAGLALGSALTVAYCARFLWGAFAVKPGVERTPVERVPAVLVWPVCVLTAASLLLGVFYRVTGDLTVPYARSEHLVPDPAGPYEVSLWHGVTGPLTLSAAMIVAGLLLHAGRVWVEGAQRRMPSLPDTQRGYDGTVNGLGRLAVWFTRHTQVGSLPVYLTVLLLTVIAVPGTMLLWYRPPLPDVTAWHSAVQVPLAVVILAAAVALVVTGHRLTAVLLVGAIGYGVAGLFLVQGAPDLALTQFLVETLTVVAVVLVLRRLPADFSPLRTEPRSLWFRVALATVAGVCVAALAVTATAVRQSLQLPREIIERAPETGAYNAVNALLVDFRALDTLGEISVLLVTVIGAAALLGRRGDGRGRPAGRRRRPGGRSRAAERFGEARWDVPREMWLPEALDVPRRERSLLLELVVRMLFPAVLVLSVYLLFAGHSRPGGGFAGGLVAGQAFVLRYLAGRSAEAAFPLPLTPRSVAGAGLVLAAVTALVPLAAGGTPLSSAQWYWDLPVLGSLHLATNVFFDLGVYLLVLGVCLKLLYALDRVRDAGDTLAPYGGPARRKAVT
ncbi:Na+/H+ antiporter subunit A [Streptomyces harbinensis]|uniref:Na+/H+ antiporter subunit A n=1 Tax=Streptomyces harbinensis TaxID=1176198 RepID=UPI00339AC154